MPNNTNSYYNNQIDTSDLILLLYRDLAKLGIASQLLNKIQRSYLFMDYDQAINQIIAARHTYKGNTQAPSVQSIKTLYSLSKLNDDPMHNASRRYYESINANAHWDSLTSSDFIAIEKFGAMIHDLKPDADTNRQVTSLCDADYILDQTNNFCEDTQLDYIERDIRTFPDSLSRQKDRGQCKNKQDLSHSRHCGLMKAEQPTPADLLSKQCIQKKTTDGYSINYAKNGFSSSHPQTPFVNSISGSAYELAVMCRMYQYYHHDSPALAQEINCIVEAAVCHKITKGYHSFFEMVAVLQSDEVNTFLAPYDIKIACEFACDHAHELMMTAAQYAEHQTLSREVNNQLVQQYDAIQLKHVTPNQHQTEVLDAPTATPAGPSMT